MKDAFNRRTDQHESWNGSERRSHTALTEEQIDSIAERAAQKVVSNFQLQVGKNILNKLAWMVGAVVLGFTLWLYAQGYIKPPR